MDRYKKIILLFVLSVCLFSCKTQQVVLEGLTFENQLKTLFPGAEISTIEVRDHFSQAYQMILKQPLDHSNPEAGFFNHYIYLSHSDYNKPTVLITEGYGARHRTYELSEMLKSNQVMVEYRFYGKSRPTPIQWEYLTNDQAIADYHSIVTKLKQLYKNKWLSTGISKGGETVLIYKSKYPKDIDVAVPYVAPLINTQEDPKTEQHINTIGTDECRSKILKYQRHILENRAAVLEELERFSEEKKMSFTEVSLEEALEYAVLEFPFSFWQWGGKCEDIPDASANPVALFNYVNQIVGFSFYNDKTYYRLLPSYYQHMKELGYYGFDTTPVKDLIKVVHKPTNMRFAPKDVNIVYNPNYIKKVRDYAENKGDNILYVYGEYDTWGACAPTPKPNVDALKMVLKGGSHSTRIKHFSESDQQKVYSKLQDWLGDAITLYPL
jgi:hypothetical protein